MTMLHGPGGDKHLDLPFYIILDLLVFARGGWSTPCAENVESKRRAHSAGFECKFLHFTFTVYVYVNLQ